MGNLPVTADGKRKGPGVFFPVGGKDLSKVKRFPPTGKETPDPLGCGCAAFRFDSLIYFST
jgi:hypothetical protein